MRKRRVYFLFELFGSLVAVEEYGGCAGTAVRRDYRANVEDLYFVLDEIREVLEQSFFQRERVVEAARIADEALARIFLAAERVRFHAKIPVAHDFAFKLDITLRFFILQAIQQSKRKRRNRRAHNIFSLGTAAGVPVYNQQMPVIIPAVA